MIKNIKLFFLISRIMFRRPEGFYYPFYMFILYFKILEQRRRYKLVLIPHQLFIESINNFKVNCSDVNNCVIISKKLVNKSSATDLICLCDNVKKLKRFTFCINCLLDDDVIFVNEVLFNNLKASGFDGFVQIQNADVKDISVGLEIDISLISTPNDLPNSIIDCLLTNYFKTVRLIYEHDILGVNVKEHCPEYFYTNYKVNALETLYFKCNKIVKKNESSENCVFCIYGETSLKQSSSIQSFIPTQNKIMKYKQFDRTVKINKHLIKKCPFGLEKYLQELEVALNPFFNNQSKMNLQPIFLVIGPDGSGQDKIISALSSGHGMHLYKINSTDLTANVYSQSETKIKNIFFKAKLCSPCLLVIDHFESFGKNNEGQYDKRIVDFFKSEVSNLFLNQKFPLFLICLCKGKDIPSELSRIFLETFEIAASSSHERELNLEWILQLHCIKHKIDINDLALKTHGLLFEDLVTLIWSAKRGATEGGITNSDTEKVIELMQKNYNKSMGRPEIPKVQWSDIGNLDEVKCEIIRTIELPLKFSKLFQNLGSKRSGILLYGPPGTGKTLLAKAIATECNLCFLSVKGPELLNMYIGQSEQNIRDVFEKARQASPCIIFFDELDSLAPNRGNAGDSGGVMDRIVSQLLAEMDDLDQSGFVFIIGATNRPDLIDPALLRPGRFDKLLYVGPCTNRQSQIDVLKALTRRFKFNKNVNLEDVLNLCPLNMTGADFYGLASNAWMSAARRLILQKQSDNAKPLKSLTSSDVIVDTEDFQVAVATLQPSLKEEDVLYYETLRRKYV